MPWDCPSIGRVELVFASLRNARYGCSVQRRADGLRVTREASVLVWPAQATGAPHGIAAAHDFPPIPDRAKTSGDKKNHMPGNEADSAGRRTHANPMSLKLKWVSQPDVLMTGVSRITTFILFSFSREERPTTRAISHQASVPQCEEPGLHVKVV